MKPINHSKVWVLTLLIFTSTLFYAQDSIPPTVIPDTVAIDTTVIDTIVIRKTLTKIKHIPRGVNLTNPVISFKKTKPLKDRYNSFRVPSFWQKENQLGINVSETAFVNWNAGGDNAISGLGFLRFSRNYKLVYSWFLF